jgi:CDP-diglyceride synthetase
LTGNKKIAPTLSPNKTREGFIGGLLFAVLTAALFHEFVFFPLFKSIVFGFIVCFSAFAGDLLASWFKRIFEVKNFSNILPGQGGMFDRFDSFIGSGAIIGLLGIPYLTVNYPDKDLVVYLMITFIFLIILLLGEFLHNFLKFKPEFSRMISHFFAGIFCLFSFNLFSSFIYVFALCIQSALFLFVSDRMGFLKSHHNVTRKTHGSSLFFVGVFLIFFASDLSLKKSLFVLPLLILTISDPIAALAGLNIKSRYWTNIITGKKSLKTFAGSLAFFISSFCILLIGLPFFYNYQLPSLLVLSFIIGLIVSLTETISSKGFDNLTIPVSMLFLLKISEHFF